MAPPTASALHEAVAQDDAELVRTLLAQGADANAQDADGTPPLHRARLSAAVAELLLQHSAHVVNSDFDI
jgi:ankyrin repeat protein